MLQNLPSRWSPRPGTSLGTRPEGTGNELDYFQATRQKYSSCTNAPGHVLIYLENSKILFLPASASGIGGRSATASAQIKELTLGTHSIHAYFSVKSTL